jgi:pimeloyl-ACP methyl ester carboxylesterase
VPWGAHPVRIEYAWANPQAPATAPLLVFLHEGLGSLAMWKGFPQQLCGALGWRGLVYSRPGYGQSTPVQPHEQWGMDFMHQQAYQLLPALLQALHINTSKQAPWLLGHSDGASIALLHAARYPQQVAGVVALAPHIMVEPLTLASIETTRQAYRAAGEGGLRHQLARHHASPDATDAVFTAWCDVWLRPAFAHWHIQAQLAPITCPVLAIQGLQDAYGTLQQTRGIQQVVPHTQLLDLPDCGHSPHRDQTAAVIAAVQAFVHPAG